MIIVRFNSGLGNQMLQYANYLALKHRYPDTTVFADIRKYNISTLHNGLEIEDIFPITLDVKFGNRRKRVSPVSRYWYFFLHNIIFLIYKLGLKKYIFIKDTGVINWNLFQLDTYKNYYLEGQWGNEKYFENVKDSLRLQFIFKKQLDPVNETIAKEIKSNNSIAVHIRRGDYVEKETFFIDLSKTEYYTAAINYIVKSIEEPVFYIFSDDPEWCQVNITFFNKYKHNFLSENKGKDNYKDLHLMSLCKHTVIANSTFSWWSGWLNSNPEKIVICPRNLFYDKKVNDKILTQFYPASWVKI